MKMVKVKEPNLQKRLNDLETELKELHDRILKKRILNQGSLTASSKQSPKPTVPKKKTQVLSNILEEQNWNTVCLNENQFTGKGSKSKTSLTEITSLSSELHNVLSSLRKTQIDKPYEEELIGELVSKKKKSKFVNNFDNEIPRLIKNKLNNICKINKNGICSNTETIDEDKEDYKIDLKLLKESIENIKKKWRDERTKREIAENALIGCRRRILILEGKNQSKEEKESSNGIPEAEDKKLNLLVDLVTTFQQQLHREQTLSKKNNGDTNDDTTNKLTSLEAKYNEEKAKRYEAEKEVIDLKTSLEESHKTIIKLEEGRNVAVAMADKFRENAENKNSAEIEKLKAEKAAIEDELNQTKEIKGISSDIVKELTHRAEQAENELIEKMKQYNNFMSKSSLNDPEVIKLLEKYKKAYEELQIEKQSKEAELKKRCKGYIKDLKAATEAAELRYKDLFEKHNKVLADLIQKEQLVNKLKNENNENENELKSLEIKLQKVARRKEQHEEQIKSLKDLIQTYDTKIENMLKEKENSKELNIELENKCSQLQSYNLEQDKMIQKLRVDLEQERDSVKIKEKMLLDQADTMKCLRVVADNTKRSLDEERILKHQLMDDIDKLEMSKEKLHSKLALMEQQLKEAEEERKKENIILKTLETRVCLKQSEWQQQILQMIGEKEKAIKTARFATEKLAKAVSDYECKLSDMKKNHSQINLVLKEKDYQIQVTKQQVEELNEEIWKTAKINEKVRNDLQSKLKKACEICTDVIDNQVELDS